MLELTEWFSRASFDAKPWLILGKGPTFDRREQFDLAAFNTLALNHVVNELTVDVAHIIDADVVSDCAGRLAQNCSWLIMPRYPHLRSSHSDRVLEDWFDELPVLRDLDEAGRLVWYNLSTSRPEGRSPVIEARDFSSEAVLRILARMGAKTIRSLGVDGGRAYASSFRGIEASTLLANGAVSFDLQFERLESIVEELELDYRPLVAPLRIFVGTEQSQLVAHRVLEYSIRKSTSTPIEFVPMLDVAHRMPRDPRNLPRTSFSFYRFMIPQLCGNEGRALYLDADMLVFGDVAELGALPFGPHKVLTSTPDPTPAWEAHDGAYLGARSVAVMLLDCGRLTWDVDDVVAGLDHGDYTYEQLMSELCLIDPGDVGDTIPPEWNDLEHHDPGVTKLLHYTVEPIQPWKNDDNPLAGIWMSMYREAVEAGAVPPDEVERLIELGHVKPSLRAALRRAPSRLSVMTNASLELPMTEQRLLTATQRVARLEARVAAMERSWSWRLGSGVVRALSAPKALLRERRYRSR